jgi:ammonia channel protein AmtB
MDFAGGTAVHITSGTAVLAFYVFYELDKKGFSKCWNGFWTILWRRLSIPYNAYKQLRRQFRKSTTVGAHGGAPSIESRDHDSEQNDAEDRSHPEEGQKKQPAVDPVRDPEAGMARQPLERLGLGPEADEPPHNVNNMVLGTALLWFGWLGFNGGSALGGNMRAVSACVSTHVAACAGGTTSLLFFWMWNALYRLSLDDGKDEVQVPSVTHFCDGAVIGLVAITPAAGFVSACSVD